MGLFSKRSKEPETMEMPPCPHTVLLTRWDSIDDIGHEDRATYYICEACQEKFSPEEAKLIRESGLEHQIVGIGADSEH